MNDSFRPPGPRPQEPGLRPGENLGLGSRDSGTQFGKHAGVRIQPEAYKAAFIAVDCEQKFTVTGDYEISGIAAAAFRLLNFFRLEAMQPVNGDEVRVPG